MTTREIADRLVPLCAALYARRMAGTGELLAAYEDLRQEAWLAWIRAMRRNAAACASGAFVRTAVCRHLHAILCRTLIRKKARAEEGKRGTRPLVNTRRDRDLTQYPWWHELTVEVQEAVKKAWGSSIHLKYLPHKALRPLRQSVAEEGADDIVDFGNWDDEN